jgi:hypothetical protein
MSRFGQLCNTYIKQEIRLEYYSIDNSFFFIIFIIIIGLLMLRRFIPVELILGPNTI